MSYIEQRGLRFVPARPQKYRPAPSRIAQLAGIAKRERIDLIHAYEWPPCLDAYFGAGLLAGVPLLCTVLSMSVTTKVPASVSLVMGTEELGAEARKVQNCRVSVLEPPIDSVRDHPGIDGSEFRQNHGVSETDLLVVSVSRLALDLKLDALVRAIDAVGLLAQKYPLRLVIVGDGPAHGALLDRAKALNEGLGREVVSLHGSELDPRPAYAAADLVVGMGSSALRAMAIGRPVIVQGECGFSEVFEPATLHLFLRQGFYGISDGLPGSEHLARQMETLLSDRGLRLRLGDFGRLIVTERFSLQRAIKLQLAIYDDVLRKPFCRNIGDALRSAVRALLVEVGNHNPRRKQERQAWAANMLAAARMGSWPPQQTFPPTKN